VIQYVDKHVLKNEYKFVQTVVEKPLVLEVEEAVEMETFAEVEAVTRVPKPQIEYVDKPVEVVVIEPQIIHEEVGVVLQHELAVEECEVMEVDTITQETKPCIQHHEKKVPAYEFQVQERIVEVPQFLANEVALEVPHVQLVDAVQQEPIYDIQEILREVPRYQIEYYQSVEEVDPHGSMQVPQTTSDSQCIVPHTTIEDLPPVESESSSRSVIDHGPLGSSEVAAALSSPAVPTETLPVETAVGNSASTAAAVPVMSVSAMSVSAMSVSAMSVSAMPSPSMVIAPRAYLLATPIQSTSQPFGHATTGKVVYVEPHGFQMPYVPVPVHSTGGARMMSPAYHTMRSITVPQTTFVSQHFGQSAQTDAAAETTTPVASSMTPRHYPPASLTPQHFAGQLPFHHIVNHQSPLPTTVTVAPPQYVTPAQPLTTTVTKSSWQPGAGVSPRAQSPSVMVQ